MSEVTPAPPPEPIRRSAAGVGPALAVGGLALILAFSILYPWGGGGASPAGEVRGAGSTRVHGAVEAPWLEPAPVRRAVERATIPLDRAAAEEPVTGPLVVPCVVIDQRGRGVEGAEVWADDGELRLYGRSGPSGSFALELDRRRVEQRLEEELPVLVGARHSAHGPSVLSPWLPTREGELRLVLRGRGAALHLEILDPSGTPIEGVEVVLGDRPGASGEGGLDVLGGRGVLHPLVPAPPGTSNAWGEVLLEGLEPGRRTISLFALGYCPRHGFVELLDGEFANRLIRMEYACSVRGRLVRDDGLPVDGGRVLGRGERPLSEVQALCDENGGYSLEHLPAGLVQLFAECRSHGRVTHTASTVLLVEPHREGTWNPVLTRQEEIRGRLVDARLAPLPGWRIELHTEEKASEPIRTTSTDLDGRFSVPISAPGTPADLFVFHPLSAGSIETRVVRDVRADTTEHVEQLEPGEEQSVPIRGRITLPDGEPAVSITFVLHRLGSAQNYRARADEFDGSFETPLLPPGDYVVIFPTHGRGWTPDTTFHLEGGEPLDIGTIELRETGQLELLPSSQGRISQTLQIRIDLVRQGISRSFLLPIFAGMVDLPLELDLAPGGYRLVIPDRGVRPISFGIRSGEATQVVVPVVD